MNEEKNTKALDDSEVVAIMNAVVHVCDVCGATNDTHASNCTKQNIERCRWLLEKARESLQNGYRPESTARYVWDLNRSFSVPLDDSDVKTILRNAFCERANRSEAARKVEFRTLDQISRSELEVCAQRFANEGMSVSASLANLLGINAASTLPLPDSEVRQINNTVHDNAPRCSECGGCNGKHFRDCAQCCPPEESSVPAPAPAPRARPRKRLLAVRLALYAFALGFKRQTPEQREAKARALALHRVASAEYTLRRLRDGVIDVRAADQIIGNAYAKSRPVIIGAAIGAATGAAACVLEQLYW